MVGLEAALVHAGLEGLEIQLQVARVLLQAFGVQLRSGGEQPAVELPELALLVRAGGGLCGPAPGDESVQGEVAIDEADLRRGTAPGSASTTGSARLQ